MNQNPCVIGVDVGGSSINLSVVLNGQIQEKLSILTPANRPESEVIAAIIQGIESIMEGYTIEGIGMGVPGLVDEEKGIVYQVTNIPSWQEVHLVDQITNYFGIETYITNDANCYVLGEKYYGKGQQLENIVGITLGTGLGVGMVIHNKLHSGVLSCAGELAVVPYLNRNYEHFCSGQFFEKEFGVKGSELFEMARAGDVKAIEIYQQYGGHLGNLIKLVLHLLSPQGIYFGGSIQHAFPFFKESMFNVLSSFPYRRVLDSVEIAASGKENMALLGAAALFMMRKYDGLAELNKA
ncbi:ROK family protein [Reichenbachiella ulvae]|uniref:ROK family protein n=1 Tax=Reichenbachiella ulvae TaxID=2980104 RepID=A0ABT3CZ52_9BACT|nr:ROK family protein [Reichenbachiella ulvae]MCV9388770.1 ROK family protein [Reichenbachiella ulvae]